MRPRLVHRPHRVTRTAALIAAALTAASLTDVRSAQACAPAYPPGATVRIADESAVILWDAAASTEHFIRRATFATDAPDFGFLVPTPSKPELAEAPDALFQELERLIAPRTIYRDTIDGIEPTLFCGFPFWMLSRSSQPAAAVGPPPVRVIEAKQVAGYDAVVLEADSAGALAAWLTSHGYASRPALEEWLAPYVAKRWLLTAFKIAGGPGAKAVSTSAVRMSFKAEKPFYPYREPSDQREVMPANLKTGGAVPDDRRLRVFVLSDARMDGVIGDGGPAWPGKTVWAGDAEQSALASTLAAAPLPAGWRPWLTAFEDESTPRPGTDDVFFSPAAQKTPVRPAPVEVPISVKLPIPLDVLALAIGVSVWLRKRARQKREAASATTPPRG